MINDEDMIKDFYNRKRKTTKTLATCVHLLIFLYFFVLLLFGLAVMS